MGTGTLYVMDRQPGRRGARLAAGKLRREKRALNVTETEESYVVQYLAMGGHKEYITKGKERGEPWLIASGVHAGSGRQVFGWSEQQRCDLVLFFRTASPAEGSDKQASRPSRIYYHNHHGDPWHYTGHLASCPRSLGGVSSRVTEKTHSRLADDFRRGLAQALSSVRPHRALFFYSTTTSCQLSHGMPVPGLIDHPPPSSKQSRSLPGALIYGSAKECLLGASTPSVVEQLWLPPVRDFWDPVELTRAIGSGRATGFVTIRGGRESEATVKDDPAGHRFGFCVQKYAPSWSEVSDFTKDQIAGYFGWNDFPGDGGDNDNESDGRDPRVKEYVEKQQPRTLCASTFFGEETVSTTYLAWLMAARGFSGFEITHFMQYSFRNWGADFLEPVLQRRHDCKRAGDAVAAECLKLIGNGSYGYNGLEASNYDDLRLMTDLTLQRRSKNDMAHLKIKHITFLGVVRVAEKIPRSTGKTGKGRGTKRRMSVQGQRSDAASNFISSEAFEMAGSNDDDDDDDDDLEDERIAEEGQLRARVGSRDGLDNAVGDRDDEDFFPAYSSDSDAGDESEEESSRYSHKEHMRKLKKVTSQLLLAQDTADGLDGANPPPLALPSSSESEEGGGEEEGMDLEEALVVAASAGDSSLATEVGKKRRRKTHRFVYRFLYAVSVSGNQKKVLNSLPRAVAVLSNSKRLFLSHLDVMFRCLDPRKAELCYVDTDSCIWSLSHDSLDRCLREERAAEWESSAIVANEEGPRSCHGLMKLEGTYRAGFFKNIKMYRLFQQPPAEETDDSEVYTRCKGVGRKTASHLDNAYFSQAVDPPKAVVHRSTLKPTRAGEIHLVREAKSLAVPFNLKRHVDSTGIHTVCFSLPNEKQQQDLS